MISLLFTPGKSIKRIEKALSLDCSAVIVDLEDSISLQEKERVRETLKHDLQSIKFSKPVYLRINDLKTEFWQEDLELLLNCNFTGIVLPKAESKQDILTVLEKMDDLGLSLNYEIVPLIETAKGIHFTYEIASSHPNVKTILFGSIDYALDIGCEVSDEGLELLFARSSLVNAARAAGVSQIIDSVYPDIQNEKGLLKETRFARRLGFTGKLVIHPNQIAPVSSVFLNYTEEEIERAKKIIELFEEAESKGIAAIQYENQMIDYPVYKQAVEFLTKVTN